MDFQNIFEAYEKLARFFVWLISRKIVTGIIQYKQLVMKNEWDFASLL